MKQKLKCIVRTGESGLKKRPIGKDWTNWSLHIVDMQVFVVKWLLC